MSGTAPIDTLGGLSTSGSTIPMIVAIIVALIVFGIPFFAVRRRNKIAIENSEDEPEPSITAEITPVNDTPQLTQQPILSTGPITVDVAKPAKPARKRRAPGVKIELKGEPKRTAKRTAKKNTDEPGPILSKEFALKHGLRLSDEKPAKKSTKTTTTGKSTKTTKTTKTTTKKSTKSK